MEQFSLVQFSLVDILLDKHRSDLKRIIQTCHIGTKGYLDSDSLNSALYQLRLCTEGEILCDDDWYDLLYEVTPEIYEQITSYKLVA